MESIFGIKLAMIKKSIKMLIRLLLWMIIAVIVVFGLPRLLTEILTIGKIETVESSKTARVAIVFGAGLQRDGTPTPVLEDRVNAAVQLYNAGKVEKILMSG